MKPTNNYGTFTALYGVSNHQLQLTWTLRSEPSVTHYETSFFRLGGDPRRPPLDKVTALTILFESLSSRDVSVCCYSTSTIPSRQPRISTSCKDARINETCPVPM